ncbi:MAG TPA: hypothetical protein VK249_13855 [Anaerolineales bacterium]|nr:hypothetical protein [Anaerolineales bacterium]
MNNRTHDLEMAHMKYANTVALVGLVLSIVLVVILFFTGMRTSSNIVAIVGILSVFAGTLGRSLDCNRHPILDRNRATLTGKM